MDSFSEEEAEVVPIQLKLQFSQNWGPCCVVRCVVSRWDFRAFDEGSRVCVVGVGATSMFFPSLKLDTLQTFLCVSATLTQPFSSQSWVL